MAAALDYHRRCARTGRYASYRTRAVAGKQDSGHRRNKEDHAILLRARPNYDHRRHVLQRNPRAGSAGCHGCANRRRPGRAGVRPRGSVRSKRRCGAVGLGCHPERGLAFVPKREGESKDPYSRCIIGSLREFSISPPAQETLRDSRGIVMTVAAPPAIRLTNYINGQWTDSRSSESRDVVNPATGEVLASVPLADAAEVNAAVEAAAAAFPDWRRTPPEDRIQPLFKLKMLLEEHIDDIARIITQENGKTFIEAKAEMRRAIENVEVACGIPMMMQGTNLEDVARGIDEMMIRQPLGVVAAIVPFNFPGMIPFWFLPYAIATGNTLVIKPSERVPLTMRFAFELLE